MWEMLHRCEKSEQLYSRIWIENLQIHQELKNWDCSTKASRKKNWWKMPGYTFMVLGSENRNTSVPNS